MAFPRFNLVHALPALLSTGCFLLIGCPQEIEVAQQDASSADGALDLGPNPNDGSQNDGSDGGPDRDLGRSDSGTPDFGEGVDGGFLDMGQDPNRPLTFSRMLLPQGTGATYAIFGRNVPGQPPDLFVGTSSGDLLFSTGGGPFTEVWHEPNNFGIRRIWGADDVLFVASQSFFWVHRGQVGNNPEGFSVGMMINDMVGRSDSEVYMVADQTNGRGLYRYDGQDVSPVIEPTDVATLLGLEVVGSDLFVSGNGKIFRLDGLNYAEETIQWPAEFSASDIANQYLYDVLSFGGRTIAVGSGRIVLERDPNQALWRILDRPQVTEALRRAAGFGDEAYAVGENASGGPILRIKDAQLTSIDPGMRANLLDMWAAGPDEYYVVGTVQNTFEPMMLKGTR